MLPSGNDAALCLAEYFGGLLKKEAHDIEDKERKEREKQIKEEQEKNEQKDKEKSGSG
jgi:hypothetical protein